MDRFMFIRHVWTPLSYNFKRSPTTFFPHSNAMSVYAEARVISLLYKWSRYRCVSDPVDVTNGIFTAVENERGKDHSVNRHLYLDVETRKLEHFPGMPGSQKKSHFYSTLNFASPMSTFTMKLKTQRGRFTRRHKETRTCEHTYTRFPGLFHWGFNFRV